MLHICFGLVHLKGGFSKTYLVTERLNKETIISMVTLIDKLYHAQYVWESPPHTQTHTHTEGYEANCFFGCWLHCTKPPCMIDGWCLHDPHINWEVIFILLDILSLTPLLSVHDVHVRVRGHVFVCVHCTSCRVRAKRQSWRLQLNGIAGCISWCRTYLCPERLAFLPAHHSHCQAVKCG